MSDLTSEGLPTARATTGRGDDYEAFLEDQEINGRSKIGPTVKSSLPWRAAKSLLKFRDQINAAFPNRSKASDGFIGDAAHCPNADGTGSSDHCPNIFDGTHRVVSAFDATHDPQNGCDMSAIVEKIRESEDDRVKYVIWNKHIFSSTAVGGVAAWEWRDYGGANPHSKHCHISVLSSKTKYDDEASWEIS